MSIKIRKLEVTPLPQNCRILSSGDRAVVVDPGGDASDILAALQEDHLTVEAILLTHSHFDHCGAVAEVKAALNCKLYAHPIEKPLRQMVQRQAQMFGMMRGFADCPEPEVELMGGETLDLIGHKFEVRFTPGHAPGHLIFIVQGEGILLAGDTLFAGSIGRTDLPGGNHQLLLQSIITQILSLPDDTQVLPGHGPDTTVGIERRSNPFLN